MNMRETARRTGNQGFAPHGGPISGPISGKMLRDVVDLKALVHGMPAPMREQVNARLNSLAAEIERVAGLEEAGQLGKEGSHDS